MKPAKCLERKKHTKRGSQTIHITPSGGIAIITLFEAVNIRLERLVRQAKVVCSTARHCSSKLGQLPNW